MRPSMCGETELSLNECSECDTLESRVGALEDELDECCTEVKSTLAGHTESITTMEDDIGNLKGQLANLKLLDVESVDALPEAGEPNVIYLLDEEMYMYVDNEWRKVGGGVMPEIGAVVCTSTNTAPSYPGTWELIEKKFKERRLWDMTPSSANNIVDWTYTDIAFSDPRAYVYIHDHEIYLRFAVTSFGTWATDDEYKMCQISFADLGINGFTANYSMAQDDLKNTLLFSRMRTENNYAAWIVTDYITGNHLASGEGTIGVDFTSHIGTSNMLDSACDKFYWKRTA